MTQDRDLINFLSSNWLWNLNNIFKSNNFSLWSL